MYSFQRKNKRYENTIGLEIKRAARKAAKEKEAKEGTKKK